MSATIAVTFVDQKTGKPFAVSDMPLEQLPESFAPATQMFLADVEWQVIAAEPMTAAEFARTGRLTLTLAKVLTMPAKDIRFTLPTITDAIPAVATSTSKAHKKALTIHEDDWRQIELISASYAVAIREQFEGIGRIFDTSFDGFGFTDIYVRSLIEPAILSSLSQHDIEMALPTPFETLDGIVYEGSDGLIAGGFAYTIGAVALLGLQVDGRVQALCLHPMRTQDAPTPQVDTLAEALAQLMAPRDLLLVDWLRMAQVSADVCDIANYLARFASRTDKE